MIPGESQISAERLPPFTNHFLPLTVPARPGFLSRGSGYQLRARRGLLRFRRILLVRALQRIARNKLMKGNNLSGACTGRQMGQKLGHACMVRHTYTGRIFLEPPQGVLQASSPPVLLSIAQKPRSRVPTNEDCNIRLCFVAQFDGTS